MSDSRINSLLEIAQKQVSAQLQVLNQRLADLELLRHQQQELSNYYDSCKQSMLEAQSDLPMLLSHRLRFLSGLSAQIRELDSRLAEMTEHVAECEKRWRRYLARQQALEAIAIDREKRMRVENNRREQKELEEVSRMTHRLKDDMTQGCEDV